MAMSAHAAVLISSKPTAFMKCTGGVCKPTAKNGTLNATDLQNMLASGNVTVTTAGAKASDIIVAAALGWPSAHTLTLDAYHSLTVNKAVTITGAGGMTILINDGGTGGDFSFGKNGNVTFWSLSSPLSINGHAYTLVNNITTLASDIAATPSGYYALAANYDASADGTYSSSPIATTFTGTFEGLGHTISKLSISTLGVESAEIVGLFQELGGVIRDFGLVQANVMAEAGGAHVGAMVGNGDNPSTILRCYATGSVTTYGTEGAAGGLVGSGEFTVINSYARVTVHGANGAFLGGLIGYNGASGLVSRSYATGQIVGHIGTGIGGLVGRNYGTITQSYATGFSGGGSKDMVVGGLVGQNYGTIGQSYSIGPVSGGKFAELGGLIGDDQASTGNISSAYWDTVKSGVTDPSQGAGTISNDPGITGLTTTQFQSGLPAGFDPSIWGETPAINSGFPYLLLLSP
jgi:hypothetical protein